MNDELNLFVFEKKVCAPFAENPPQNKNKSNERSAQNKQIQIIQIIQFHRPINYSNYIQLFVCAQVSHIIYLYNILYFWCFFFGQDSERRDSIPEEQQKQMKPIYEIDTNESSNNYMKKILEKTEEGDVTSP